MSSTVELVLAVEATAAREWMTGPAGSGKQGARAHHARAESGTAGHADGRQASHQSRRAPAPGHDQIGMAIADALNRMPGFARVGNLETSVARAFFERSGTWRVMLADIGGGGRRVTAVRARALAPGVWRCETVCDETLEAGAPLALSDTLPPVLKDASVKPDKLAPSPMLSVRRGAWRWDGPDGTVVDIALHDVQGAVSESDGPAAAQDAQTSQTSSSSSPPLADQSHASIAFCELRLSARVAEAQAEIEHESPATTQGAEHTQGADATPAAAPEAVRGPTAAATQALFAAARVLVDTLPVFPALADGYSDACGLTSRDVPVRAARIDLIGTHRPHAALIEIGSSIACQWFGNERGVRDGADPEFVHQMRIALRRLKTLLKTFPRWADEAWQRAIAPELLWLGGLLGQARDLDVFVDMTLPALAAADVDAAAWAPLQARAAERRREAYVLLQDALHTRRYAALSLAWLQWLASQRFSSGPPAMNDEPLAGYAAKRVRKHYARLIAKPELTALTAVERHRQRIEAKRLRYTLEFFESLASRKTRREGAKQLGRIQSVLGDGSDAATALKFLQALDVPPYEHGFARGWCEAMNRWSAIEGERLLRELRKPKIARTP